jgi:hypothetical protein
VSIKLPGSAPYTRPLRQFHGRKPWIPSDRIFLADAFDKWAHAKFDGWSGQEADARSGDYTAPEPPKEPEGRKTRYLVNGRAVLMPYEEALALFEREEPDLRREWQEERDAYARFVEASNEFRQSLYDGRLTAEMTVKSGEKTYPIEKDWWRRDDVEAVLQSSRLEFTISAAGGGGYDHPGPSPSFAAIPPLRKWPAERSHAKLGDRQRGWVTVSRDELQALFPGGDASEAAGERAGETAPAAGSPAGKLKRKRSGGRKPGRYVIDLKRCLQFYDQMEGKSLAEARLVELTDFARRWFVKHTVPRIPQRTALEASIKKARDEILDAKQR